MFKKLFSVTAVVGAGLMSVGGAQAALMTYFGENKTPSQQVVGDPVLAKGNFLINSGPVLTENFEGFARGDSAPLSLVFTGPGGPYSATLTNASAGSAIETFNTLGRFNTSGASGGPVAGKWWDSGSFTINFGTPISAFGFFGTDIGDFNGQVRVTLTDVAGAVISRTINNSLGIEAGLLFWGFTDDVNRYTKIAFDNTAAAGIDGFGFDDMVVHFAPGVVNPTPEPDSMALVGLSLLGLATLRRRRS